MAPLIGFAPDLDPTTPGILTNCTALLPSLKGMEGAPAAQSNNIPALAAACKGAMVLRLLDNTTRFFAGTATAIYEAGASSWTDRTRASGGAYALGTDNNWRFAISGDTCFAAAKSDILQSTSSGAFANAAANAPKAAIVETAGGFIFLADVSDQGAIYTGTDRPHGWWAARSAATWTPSIANEAYTGELTSTPGKIRAARRFGQTIVLYKDRSMYLGLYEGQSGWTMNLIPGESGAVSQEAVVDVGTTDNPVHIFMGFDDFYRYDGSKPVSIGNPVRETVFAELNKSFTYACKTLHDRVNKRIFFFYPVASQITPEKCVVYNYAVNRWGRDDRTIQAAVEFSNPGITYDDLGASYSTYADLPSLSYDTAFWSTGYPSPAIFNTSHRIQTLDGVVGTSTMTTGDYGSDEYLTFLSLVQPLFLTKPTSATMTNYYRESLGDSLTADTAATMDSKGRFAVHNGGRSSNWHRASFEFSGAVEMSSIRAEMAEDGLE